MTRFQKYLYCIIRCSEERTFGDVSAIGNPSGAVHMVTHDGLAVVVSDSPVRDYESSRANLLAHERAQERVMREFTILPIRFGTVANGPSPVQDIKKLLQKRGQEFEDLLTEMEGRVEVGLKALWRDEKRLFEEILAENEGVRRFRNSLRGKSHQATHFDRIRLGEMVKDALDRKRSAEAASLLAPLRRIARRTVENPIVVDRMIINAAFLVNNSRAKEFDEMVSKLDEELGQRVILKYVGPVPPYNFVNVVVNWQQV